jgi:hypothetical protein
LNAHAYHAGATSDIKKMIDNMYGGKGAAQGVEDYASNPMASAEEYVPESWHRAGKDKVYNAVVKPYCRTCHISREEAPDNPFIWEEYPKFEIYLASVQHLVCGTHEMPNAEQTLKNFWNSSARAHLAGAFPNEMRGACKPED